MWEKFFLVLLWTQRISTEQPGGLTQRLRLLVAVWYPCLTAVKPLQFCSSECTCLWSALLELFCVEGFVYKSFTPCFCHPRDDCWGMQICGATMSPAKQISHGNPQLSPRNQIFFKKIMRAHCLKRNNGCRQQLPQCKAPQGPPVRGHLPLPPLCAVGTQPDQRGYSLGCAACRDWKLP